MQMILQILRNVWDERCQQDIDLSILLKLTLLIVKVTLPFKVK